MPLGQGLDQLRCKRRLVSVGAALGPSLAEGHELGLELPARLRARLLASAISLVFSDTAPSPALPL